MQTNRYIYKVIQLFKGMGSEKLHNLIVNALYENPYKHLEFAYNSIISKTTEFEMYIDGLETKAFELDPIR